jgi:multiple sugar transport system permease protein
MIGKRLSTMKTHNQWELILQRVLPSFADRYFSILALGPIVVLLTISAIVPFVIMLWLSLTDFSFNLPGHDGNFIGFENYVRALTADERLYASVKLQLSFLALTIPIQFCLGFVSAIVLWQFTAIHPYMLAVLSLPLLLAPVTVGMIWRLLLHGDYGPIGYYLTHIPSLAIPSILGTPTVAFYALVAIDIWQWSPLFTIVLFSALHALPEAPFQAALLDGAKPARVFWTITLPLLRPAITVILLIRFMDSFKEFDKIVVLTRGGPASATELLSVYAWIVSFDHGDLGYGSSITVLIYIVIYIASIVLFGTARKDWR